MKAVRNCDTVTTPNWLNGRIIPLLQFWFLKYPICLLVTLFITSCGQYANEPVSAPEHVSTSGYVYCAYDSILGQNIQFVTDSNWARPKYALWEYWSGIPWYRGGESLLVAYGDTIIRPDVSGWVTDGGRPTSNFNPNAGFDGIRADGIPYWLDSLWLYGPLSIEPLIDVSWVMATPYWYPNVFPPYVKWREKMVEWQGNWGFWPENGIVTKRFDYAEYSFEIGDTVEVTDAVGPSFQYEFWMDHRYDPTYINSETYGWVFVRMSPDSAPGNSYMGLGVVTERWVHNQIRYYRVLSDRDYSKRFYINRVRVREEIRVPKYIGRDWTNGGEPIPYQ